MITGRSFFIKISRIVIAINFFVVMPCHALKPVVILTGGFGTALGQSSQALVFANTAFKYQPESSSAINPLTGAFFGAEYQFGKAFAWQFGLATYQSVKSTVSGDEIQVPVDNPDATNDWNYQYKILSRQLLFENKFSFIAHQNYHPYFLIGLGKRLNRAYAFQVTPTNSGEVATAIFGSKTNKAFVYTIGVGVDVDISQHMRLGAGYRYAYLGKYDLGQGTLDTGEGGSVFLLPALKTNHSYNQEIVIQLTYLFADLV